MVSEFLNNGIIFDAKAVLILVLVEDGLGAWTVEQFKDLQKDVLILVLVEDGLGALCSK